MLVATITKCCNNNLKMRLLFMIRANLSSTRLNMFFRNLIFASKAYKTKLVN